jgi:hypothetical protein
MVELFDGEHECVDCSRRFDLVPVERARKPPPEPEKQSVSWENLKWVAYLVLALGAVAVLWKAADRITPTVKNVEKITEVPVEIEKIVEKPVEKIVFKEVDKICPEIEPVECPKYEKPVLSCPKCPSCPNVNVEQAKCEPEIVYVPQKQDCTSQIEAACSEYKNGVRWLIEKGRNPAAKPTDSYDHEDDWDEPLED